MRASRHGGAAAQAGYSLVELMIAIVIMVPLLSSVIGSERAVIADLNAQQAAANAAETCRRFGSRVTTLVRSGYLSTVLTRASEADVNAKIAAQAVDPLVIVPNVGDWISMPPASTRTVISVRSAEDTMPLVTGQMTPAREFEFVMDGGETADGSDDDGDGLIDEGTLVWSEDGVQREAITGIEKCTFRLEGRRLVIDLRCARRDGSGRLMRSSLTHQVHLRNN